MISNERLKQIIIRTPVNIANPTLNDIVRLAAALIDNQEIRDSIVSDELAKHYLIKPDWWHKQWSADCDNIFYQSGKDNIPDGSVPLYTAGNVIAAMSRTLLPNVETVQQQNE